MKFSTWGLTYADACSLIDALKASGVDANITAGGIAMHPEPAQLQKMHDICAEFNTCAVAGNTLHQELVLNREPAQKWIQDRVPEKIDFGD